MGKFLRVITLLSLLIAFVPALQVHAQTPEPICLTGNLPPPSGAIFVACIPPGEAWNGDMLVYAHGYVAFNEPMQIPEDQLVFDDGTSIPALMLGQGYGFATTSYRENGLAVLTGLEDIVMLVQAIKMNLPAVQHIYLGGPSEGGLITILGLERFPELFTAGFSLCGPVGDFRKQINYWGDFRVLFDYYFPRVVPGAAMDIPQELIDNWEGIYKDRVRNAVAARPAKLSELMRVSKAKYDLTAPSTKVDTTEDLMWYSVFATMDGIAKLGGIPYDNRRKIYTGSSNDVKLNKKVKRYTADPAALMGMIPYQTSGVLQKPLVTMHTTGDPIIPYWHETLYGAKVLAKGSVLNYLHIPIVRYGHCSFTSSEALAGFALMIYKATGKLPSGAPGVLPSDEARMEYRQLLEKQGLKE